MPPIPSRNTSRPPSQTRNCLAGTAYYGGVLRECNYQLVSKFATMVQVAKYLIGDLDILQLEAVGVRVVSFHSGMSGSRTVSNRPQ